MYRFAFVPNRLGIYVDHLTLDVPFSRTYVFKTLFTWSGGPRSSGVTFYCFVSPRA